MKLKLGLMSALLIAAGAIGVDAQTIANVRAQQRPGTKYVDITYDLIATNTIYLTVAVSTNDGASYTVQTTTLKTSSGSLFNGTATPGFGRQLVWDAGTDWSNHFSTLVRVKITASETLTNGDYMVIDLSGGPSAGSYPVNYLAAVPPGGWTDEYKTTKLVFRRIPAGTFTMGYRATDYPGATDSGLQVTISQPFYIGVFEVTQQQWERVTGAWPSYFTNASYRNSRPVEWVSYNAIRGTTLGTNWPASSSVDTNTFMGRLRFRTGKAFDLPTESQWEYAGRAGTTTALNSGQNLTNTDADAAMNVVGRYRYNHPGGYSGSSSVSTDGGTAKVGSYQANAWGLYDIHGNVWEWCLDWYGTYPGTVTDPVGATSGSSRVFRGGGWTYTAYGCRAAGRINYYPTNADSYVGFRAALPPGQQ